MRTKKKNQTSEHNAQGFAQRDPFYEREKQRYKHPIPSRELILSEMESIGKPATLPQLTKRFSLSTEEAIEGLRRRLMAMTRDGQIMANRRERFAIVKHMALVRGVVVGHRDGYGFVIPDDQGGDLFLTPREMRQVMPADVVLCRIKKVDARGRREGAIVEVLERHTHELVGRFRRQDNCDYVQPVSKQIAHDIVIPSGKKGRAKEGQFVVVSILTQPGMHHPCTGKVSKILGDHMSPGMEVELAIRNHGIPDQWPEAVLRAAGKIPKTVSSKSCKGREDLRHLPFVTIDGEDAKDFDDAVYCTEKSTGGWQLWVAIADVSHYVQPDDDFDLCAQERGNSVYFANRVIPMLPEALSNGICSLKPNVDRMALVCSMSISAHGNLESATFHRALIQSHARLTYAQVSAYLDGQVSQVAKKIRPHMDQLAAVYTQLMAQRCKRGALDFSTVATRILFDSKGKIDCIVPVKRLVSHRIIEECMLVANVAAAQFLMQHKQPAVFRVHQGPDSEKLQDLRKFLQALGLSLSGKDQPSPADYAQLLRTIEGRADAHLIQTVLLRSLKQAFYTPENDGHFGLSFDAYVHFTSPIRRYPDLLVHRFIIAKLEDHRTKHWSQAALEAMAQHCSTTERRADLATREADDWLKCEYMLNKLGQEFSGVISAVTGFGFYVSLDDVHVEGLVHIANLKNDYYTFEPAHHCLRAKQDGSVYRLGDCVRVLVARVSLDDRQIDFTLLD